MTARVLLVDDEPAVLDGYRRQLRREFDLITANSGDEALTILKATDPDRPIEVIVSDQRMPEMDGITLLRHTATISPDTVRVMLTGESGQLTAIQAVNEGAVFRFLNKPCDPETLRAAIEAAVKQHRLVTAERDLLGKTVGGAIHVLTDVLSLVNPSAFGQASRARRIVRYITAHLDTDEAREIELAAMLSQLGCVTIPQQTLERAVLGEPLGPEQQRMYASHPSIGAELVGKIPRLESLAAMIEHQNDDYDRSGTDPGSVARRSAIPLGARILRVALDFERLVHRGVTPPAAYQQLRAYTGRYDDRVLAALEESLDDMEAVLTVTILVTALEPGMVIAEDLVTQRGAILMTSGQEVSTAALNRVLNFLGPEAKGRRLLVNAPPPPTAIAAA